MRSTCFRSLAALFPSVALGCDDRAQCRVRSLRPVKCSVHVLAALFVFPPLPIIVSLFFSLFLGSHTPSVFFLRDSHSSFEYVTSPNVGARNFRWI